MMTHQFEIRPKSCCDRFNESCTVSTSKSSIEMPREPNEDKREAPPPSEKLWQEFSSVSGVEKDECLRLKAKSSLKHIGNLLELYETLMKQLEAEKGNSGKNEKLSKVVESCESSEEGEVCGPIGSVALLEGGHRAESSDDSSSSSETERTSYSASFVEAEQDSSLELDWSLIDKEMESLTDSLKVEQDDLNDEAGKSFEDKRSKSWINSLEVPQDDSSQDVDWSFDDGHLKPGPNSLDALQENSNQESKRTIEGVAMIRPIGNGTSECRQCGRLYDEYISNLCKCFECPVDGENVWKTTAGNDGAPRGTTLEASIRNDRSVGADQMESPTVKSFGIYSTYSDSGGEERLPDADAPSKSNCLLLHSPIIPSTPNPMEEQQSPISAKIEVSVTRGDFEALSSATDEYYNPVKAAGTYGPIGTPPTVDTSCELRRRPVISHD